LSNTIEKSAPNSKRNYLEGNIFSDFFAGLRNIPTFSIQN